MRLDQEYIDGLLAYIKSGELGQDFEYSPEERRYEILDFLEKLMELGEVADEAATKIIFKNTQLGQVMGEKTQK
ncbi:MAG: hypothetical protein U5L00_20240 [Desulfovermiculus sp.]|nr:hypothetical protein [Desulfovermiculus sp.]